MSDGTCLNCGAVTSNPKFCSRECSRQDERLRKSERVTLTCACGLEFEARVSAVARGRKYCSAACYHKVGPGRRAEFVWVNCPCGVKFETRAWRVADGRGKFCSRKCAERHRPKADPPRPKNRCTPAYSHRWRLAKYHGMTPGAMLALVAEQDGRCYLCREFLELDRKFAVHIDHDHRCCPAGYSCESLPQGLGMPQVQHAGRQSLGRSGAAPPDRREP